MDSNLLLLLGVTVAGVVALVWGIRLHRIAREASMEIHRSAVHQRELAQLLETHQQLAELQNLTETAVDSGTSTIRSIHKEIANIPFEILENIPQTKGTTRVVRGVHDITADGVYASISTLNKQLGKRLRKQMRLDQDSEKPTQDEDPKE